MDGAVIRAKVLTLTFNVFQALNTKVENHRHKHEKTKSRSLTILNDIPPYFYLMCTLNTFYCSF